jgi:hypothetical protein
VTDLLEAYRRLEALTEEELAHVSVGDLAAAAAVVAQRARLILTLPESPPAAARPYLERCRDLQDRVSVSAQAQLDGLGREASGLDRVRRVAQGYDPGAEPRRTVDHAA